MSMVRRISSQEPRTLGDISFGIRKAVYHNFGQCQAWTVELTVGRKRREVDGWAFIDPDGVEIRFEKVSSMEPPGFLSGVYLQQTLQESSLSLLLDQPSKEDLVMMELAIRHILVKCCFCVRSLTDAASGVSYHRAISYRYGIANIAVK